MRAELSEPILPPSLLEGGEPIMKDDFSSTKGTFSCRGGGISTFAVAVANLPLLGFACPRKTPDIEPGISPYPTKAVK